MTTEREFIDDAQKAIGDLKRALRSIQKMNAEAGRDAAANAAMKHRGQAITLHAEMTESMTAFYPQFASEVQRAGER